MNWSSIERFLLDNDFKKTEENQKEGYRRYSSILYSTIFLYEKEHTLYIRSRYVHGEEVIVSLVDVNEMQSIQCFTEDVTSGYATLSREVIAFSFKDGSNLEVRK